MGKPKKYEEHLMDALGFDEDDLAANQSGALTQRQMLTLFFQELGMQPKFSVINRLMMRMAGLFVPAARESVEMMYQFEQPFIVDRRPGERDHTPIERHAAKHRLRVADADNGHVRSPL